MRLITWPAVVGVSLFGLGAGLSTWNPVRAGEKENAGDKQPADQEIQNLVAQLTGQDAQKQKAAARRLIAIGEPALAALKQAAKEGGAAVRQRVRKVEEEIGKRVKGFTDPAGVTLALKLTARKKTFEMDLGGKPENEFSKQVLDLSAALAKDPLKIRTFAAQLPPAPQVDLDLKLRNTGKKTIHFMFGRRIIQYRDPRAPDADIVFVHGHGIALEIRGPGALSFCDTKAKGTFRDAEGYRGIPLEPGKSFSRTLKELRGGFCPVYWTRPGEYAVRAVFHPVLGAEGKEPYRVTVYSNWVNFKVVAKKRPKERRGRKGRSGSWLTSGQTVAGATPGRPPARSR
jgi:hypothetical protein